MKTLTYTILFTVCLSASLPLSLALSWPLCDPAGLVWMTERPVRADLYPGSNLWFFCNSGINVLGDAVDVCLGEGTLCDAVATANTLCQIIGYDQASEIEGDVTTTKVLAEGQAVRSLSGEFCLADGNYALERPTEENEIPVSGGPCTVLEKLVCVRSTDSMNRAARAAFVAITMENVTGVAPVAELAAGELGR